MKIGDSVIYTGCAECQAHVSVMLDPRGVLADGKVYVVSDVEVHTWHTRVYLEGVDSQGVGFNSACFEVLLK